MVWESELTIDYLFEDFKFCTFGPRCFTVEHLINDYTKAPEICKVPTYRVRKHLGTSILWRTNESGLFKMIQNIIFFLII